MRKTFVVASGVALASLLCCLMVCLMWLGREQAAGPPHADLLLPGGVPATFTLPADVYGPASVEWPDAVQALDRPPAVVLVHGFASDRLGMGTLARSLAAAGYAVLTPDLRGHGANRNPFFRDRVSGARALGEDIGAAVQFLRTSPHVDGERISVMGHSMGASAALEYGTRDPGLDGLVLISGGRRMEGPHRPPNVLLVVAAGDPERIHARSAALAGALAGVPDATGGERFGEFRRFDAVRYVEVPGVEHATVVVASRTVSEIVAWLDGIYGRDREAPVGARDSRQTPLALGLLAFALLLPGIGALAGRIAPRCDEPPPQSGVRALAALAAALAATLPLFAVRPPFGVLPLEVADIVVVHLGVAGLAVLAGLRLLGRETFAGLVERPAATSVAAAAGLVCILLLLSPLTATIHSLALTPERALAWALCTAALLPFTLAFHHLLRRGPPLRALSWSMAGRVVVLAVIVLGVVSGISPGVVLLMLPILVILFLGIEAACVGLYATSRNVAAIALLEASWLAWVFAAILPIRI